MLDVDGSQMISQCRERELSGSAVSVSDCAKNVVHCRPLAGRRDGSPLPDRPAADRAPVLLAVFAHPDDEAGVGAVLAKCAAAGVSVYLASAQQRIAHFQPLLPAAARPDSLLPRR